jgi:hypothetical protein
LKGKGTILSPIRIPFIPNDSFICPAATVLNLLHMTKEKNGVKSHLFINWDMGIPLAVNKAKYLLKNLLSDLGFSEDKTHYSFKYVAMSHLVNQNVSIESINEAACYATNSKIVRDRYAISAAQMQIHKLLAEATPPTVDTLSSKEEHPTFSFESSVSYISSKGSITSKRSFLGNVHPKSKPLINLSTFTPKSFQPSTNVTLQSLK